MTTTQYEKLIPAAVVLGIVGTIAVNGFEKYIKNAADQIPYHGRGFAYFPFFQNFVACALIIFLATTIFFVIGYGRVRQWAVFVVSVVLASLIASGIIFTHGYSNAGAASFLITTPIPFLLLFGFVALAVCEHAGAPMRETYFVYLYKVVDAIVVTLAMGIAIEFLLIVVVQMMLHVVGITFSFQSEFFQQLDHFLFVFVPLAAVMLVYDFEKLLHAQRTAFGIVKFLSVLGYAASWIFAPLLAVYLALVLHAGPQKIFLTESATIFLVTAAVSSLALCGAWLWHDARERSAAAHAALWWCAAVVIIENFVLILFTLGAVVRNALLHGMTLHRYEALGCVAVAMITLVGYAAVLVRAHVQNKNVQNQNHARRCAGWQTATAAGLAAFAVVWVVVLIIWKIGG